MNGKAKDFWKDAYGQLANVVEHNSGNNATTTYAWDAVGNLSQITDALSNVRTFTYDGLGRRLTAQDLHASGDGTFGTWNYTYDDAGNTTQTVDPKSQTVNYTYDANNRPLTEDYTGASGTEITYSYDSCTNGKTRLCIASSTASRISYTYNPLGMKASEAETINGTSTTFTTQYGYDRQGNLLLLTYPDGAQAQYAYNGAGLVNSLQEKESGAGSFSNILTNVDYAPTGQPTYLQYANGVNTTNTYDLDSPVSHDQQGLAPAELAAWSGLRLHL